MTSFSTKKHASLLFTFMFSAFLSACGGGDGSSVTGVSSTAASTAPTSQQLAAVVSTPTPTPTPTPTLTSTLALAPLPSSAAAVRTNTSQAMTTDASPVMVDAPVYKAVARAVVQRPSEPKSIFSIIFDAVSNVVNTVVDSVVAFVAPEAVAAPAIVVAAIPAPVVTPIVVPVPVEAIAPVTAEPVSLLAASAFGVQSTGRKITDVKFESTATSVQTNSPVTFGQVFAAGDVAATDSLVGTLDSGAVVPLQMDVKATYPNGSVRHAVLSAVLPSLAASQVATMSLAKGTIRLPPAAAATPVQLLAAGFSTTVSLTVGGVQYSASADDLLGKTTAAIWLSGSIANEWMVSAPFRTADGVAHPHLTARFDVRSYAGMNKAKVDVVVENNWAYVAAPQNIKYDAQVSVGGESVYTKAGLNHYHHARWKKTFWWNAMPQVVVKHNTGYLMASRAVPNYDQSVTPSAAALSRLRTSFTGAVTEPMQNGVATPYMPQTGGRPDIGLLPGWAVTYLLSMDKDAKAAMMGTADLAGSWSSHYRDKNTDRVVSLFNYPYMTLLGREGDTLNPITRKYEAFPVCGGDCTSALTADSSHQPNFAYLPYIVSGDHYYLEELQFWAMFNIFQHNPGYRDSSKGLVKPDQTRGQAWSMRALAEAAFITPDADPLKFEFNTFLTNNLDWFNATYNNGAPANALGAITDENAMVYDGGMGLAPWQDDFFTMAIGHAAELGFAKASQLLSWKANFPVNRMVGDGFCWVEGSMYKMILRTSPTSPNFTSMASVYTASEVPAIAAMACGSAQMATALGIRTGDMVGYADVLDGYPAYMQPALAYSVDSGNAKARSAWTVFQARANKPNYAEGAQFAIVPR